MAAGSSPEADIAEAARQVLKRSGEQPSITAERLARLGAISAVSNEGKAA